LLIDKCTGFFNVVDIIGIAQPALATEFFCRATTGRLKRLGFFMGLHRCHGH
jgi:hypothetical protein